MTLFYSPPFPSCEEAWESLRYSKKEIQKQWTVRVAECSAQKKGLGRSISRHEAEDGGMGCDEFFSIVNR